MSELFHTTKDQHVPNTWRVERLVEDGQVEQCSFYGPGAESRAMEYAKFKNDQQRTFHSNDLCEDSDVNLKFEPFHMSIVSGFMTGKTGEAFKVDAFVTINGKVWRNGTIIEDADTLLGWKANPRSANQSLAMVLQSTFNQLRDLFRWQLLGQSGTQSEVNMKRLMEKPHA